MVRHTKHEGAEEKTFGQRAQRVVKGGKQGPSDLVP